jgi:hypothetical protein
MAEGPLSMATTVDDDLERSVHMVHPGGSRHSRTAAAAAGDRSGRWDRSAHGGSVHGGSRHVVIGRKKSSSVHGGTMQSIESYLNEPATAADRMAAASGGLYAGLSQGPDGGAVSPIGEPVEELATAVGFSRTLSLHHMPSGLVLASYQLEPSVHGGTAHGS